MSAKRSSAHVASTLLSAGKAAAVLALLVLAAGPSLPAHAQSAPPPSTAHIAHLIAAMQASVAVNPPGGGVAVPPEARDATGPSTVLHRVLDDLDALIAGRGARALTPADRRQVVRARDAVQGALDMYGTVSRSGTTAGRRTTATRGRRRIRRPRRSPPARRCTPPA